MAIETLQTRAAFEPRWAGGAAAASGHFFIDVTASPYNADPTGILDATAVLQSAINAAEAYIASNNVYQPQAPAVYIPSGIYKVTGTITVTKPIRIFGDGEESSVLAVAATFNAPVIKIAPTTAQSTYVTFRLDNFALKGPQSIVSAPTFALATRDGMDGIAVDPGGAATDTTVDFYRLRITGMTGNGIHFVDFGNSPKVLECTLEVNSEAGIRVNGTYCTNPWFEKNIIRENRIGIMVKSAGGSTLGTGRITDNLIEANNGRTTGTIGSADMPSVGIWLSKTYDLVIDDNYYEFQWNDLYVEDTWSFNRVRGNVSLFDNAFSLATTYGPPVRRAGWWMNGGGPNVIEANLLLNQPTQPGGCSNANWTPSDGSGYAATYEHITDNQGVNVYRDNYSPNTALFAVSITNPFNRHTIQSAVYDAVAGDGRRYLEEKLFGRKVVFPNYTITEEAGAAVCEKSINSVRTTVERVLFPTAAAGNALSKRCKPVGGADTEYMVVRPAGIAALQFDPAPYNVGSSTGPTHEYGTAAPVGGTWQLGAIRWNVNPSVGNPIGWMYTGAGWVAMPNL
jgi:hypothetical protein